MLGLVKFLLLTMISLSINFSSHAENRKYNIGKLATKTEVAGWDIDVRPDGVGAPKALSSLILLVVSMSAAPIFTLAIPLALIPKVFAASL